MSLQDKFKDVFAANPTANEIYVCDGMPFLSREQADGHSHSSEGDVEIVKRPAKAKKPTAAEKKAAKKLAEEKAAEAKALAEKEAADAKALAEKEAADADKK